MFALHELGKDVCFDLVHEDYPFVTVGTSSELTIPDFKFQPKDEIVLPWEEDYNDFPITVGEDVDEGIVSVFEGKSKDPTKLLLRFSLKKVKHRCSEVDLLEVGKNLKAIVYCPIMGGDHVIIAIGKDASRLCPEVILKSLPAWNTPFNCPLLLQCEISCDENGVVTKNDYTRMFCAK